MVQQKLSKDVVSGHPMDVVGAMTQGQIGYMLQQKLMNHFKKMGLNMQVCTILNHVIVDKNDPEFIDDNASTLSAIFYPKKKPKK